MELTGIRLAWLKNGLLAQPDTNTQNDENNFPTPNDAGLDGMNVGSLFSGIGGIDIGFQRQGFTTGWFVENEPYAISVLRKNFPGIPVLGDIATIDFGKLPRVDIIVGGFPCQDASVARSNGKGIEGSQTGLWRYFKEAIRTIRPQFALIENVPNLINRGFERVLCDLAQIGYNAQWQTVRAGSLGYPHNRERLFILAYTDGNWFERILEESLKTQVIKSIRVPQETLEAWYDQLLEPPLLGAGHGFPRRVDRIRTTGNAVVPDVAEIFAPEIRTHLDYEHTAEATNQCVAQLIDS